MGKSFKFAVANSPSTKDEANLIAIEALQYCKERLGSPSETGSCSAVKRLPKSAVREIRTLRSETTGRKTFGLVSLVIRNAEDGNVVLQTEDRMGIFQVGLFLTSAAVRPI
jgi:hypothetical protein